MTKCARCGRPGGWATDTRTTDGADGFVTYIFCQACQDKFAEIVKAYAAGEEVIHFDNTTSAMPLMPAPTAEYIGPALEITIQGRPEIVDRITGVTVTIPGADKGGEQ